MKKLLRVICVIALMALMAGPALANLAVDFSSVNNNFTNNSWCLGWEFSTNASVTVNSLGFYDDLKNGLTQTHDVGIFNAAGNLLVSTAVSNADPLTSFFRFHAINPYTLAAGQTYYIQAVTGSENYTWATNGFVVDPSITFIKDAFFSPPPSGLLTFPNASAGITAAQGGAVFGPNFTTSAVPVPPTLLLLGSGLLGLAGWRRLKKG